MAFEDLEDHWDYDGYDYFCQYDRYSTSKVCKFCGQGGLNWAHTGSGWRLFDRDGMHSCLQKGQQRKEDCDGS